MIRFFRFIYYKLYSLKIININRHKKDKIVNGWMLLWLLFVLLMPFIMAIGLYLKSEPLLENHSLLDLLFSTEWKPSEEKFGLLPFIISSIWVTLLALIIAGPICLLSAIHLTQYAPKTLLTFMRPIIDILAGIPSIIYGVWGVVGVVPFIANYIAPIFGKQISGYSIMAGAIVLAIMIIPFILNIMIEVFRSIPDELTEASLSLGASRWETIKLVILRKAFPGLISAITLGLARAFGETIAVLMVVGNVSQIPSGTLQPGYPLPALIANNYGEMLSIPKYDSALMFSALVLFVIVLIFNLISRTAIIRFEKNI